MDGVDTRAGGVVGHTTAIGAVKQQQDGLGSRTCHQIAINLLLTANF